MKMERGFVLRFLLKRKIIVGLFIVFIFGLGIYSINNLDKELFPSVKFNQTLIMIETEEMPAEDVEEFVTIPIENALEKIEDVKSYETTSSSSNSLFVVDLIEGADDDVTKDIENEVNSLTHEINGIDDVFVMQASTQGQYELFMDISGGDMKEMSDYASDVVKPKLESLQEVSEVFISGLQEKEIIITLEQEKLADYNMEQEEVIAAIEQMNTNTSMGNLEKEAGDPTIRWNTAFHSLKDVKETPIQTDDGIKKLSTFASVKEEVSEQANFAWKNGNPDFLLLQIERSDGFTQIDMADAIRAEVESIKKEHDNGIEINEIAAQADYVSNAIDGVTSNILIGGIIAVIVLLLFLRNFRATVIIGLSIPASVLLTILTMTFLDYSFNLLSLVGLGLGIGMMVDASIVVLESIFNKKEQSYSNVDAVILGTKEVVGAVISSMLTTIVVFVPIVLMDDEVGKMMIVLTVVVAVTLISSVLIAFTFIPVLSENFLKVKKSKKGKLNLIGKYGSIIEWITGKRRRRIGILILFVVMFFSSFLLLPKIPKTFMPDILDRYAEVIVEVEPGVTTEEREDIAIAMNNVLEDIPDVESNVIIDNMEVVLSLINLTPEDDKTMEQSEVNEQILQNLRTLEKDYPIKNVGAAMDGAMDAPIELRVSGESLEKLEEIGTEVKDDLEALDDVSSANMEIAESAEEYTLQLNDKKMKDDDVGATYLYAQLSQMFAHVPAGDVVDNGDVIPVFIENDLNISDKKKLLDTKLTTINGEKKLSGYVDLKKTDSLIEINRADGERYISINADIEGQDMGAVYNDINNIIENRNIDQGYTIEVTGDLEEQQRAVQDLVVIFMISLFLVFVVMAIQFNSLKHPLIILFIIPLTITGVLIGLFITQKELNVMSGIGVVMLVGIVLNNGILLIDRLRQLRNDGLDTNTAMINAAKERIRPIFMTTLTTVGGMVPLALASGTSSDYQSPLAVVIISGLLFSTFITLILIPSVYLLFEDIGNGWKRIFRRKKNHEVVEVETKAQ